MHQEYDILKFHHKFQAVQMKEGKVVAESSIAH